MACRTSGRQARADELHGQQTPRAPLSRNNTKSTSAAHYRPRTRSRLWDDLAASQKGGSMTRCWRSLDHRDRRRSVAQPEDSRFLPARRPPVLSAFHAPEAEELVILRPRRLRRAGCELLKADKLGCVTPAFSRISPVGETKKRRSSLNEVHVEKCTIRFRLFSHLRN